MQIKTNCNQATPLTVADKPPTFPLLQPELWTLLHDPPVCPVIRKAMRNGAENGDIIVFGRLISQDSTVAMRSEGWRGKGGA